MPDTLHKTLIIRLSSAGDIILSSLLVRAFRHRFPSCQVDFLVKSEYAGLVAHNPHLSRVMQFPARGTWRDLRALRSTIRKEGYDQVIDIHDSNRSRFLSFGASAVARIRKRKIARFVLVNTKINIYHLFGGSPAVAERYLEPVRPYGVQDDGGGLEVFLGPDDGANARERIADLQASGGLLIGMAPGSRHGNKTWLPERFAEAGAELTRRRGAGILLLGSAEEIGHCRSIERMILERHPAARLSNLAGTVTLTECAAVLDHCAVVITNDSGLMHLAAARRRPVVALFGPTVSAFGFFPFRTPARILQREDVECRPCTSIGLASCPRRHFHCMTEIPASAAVEAAEQFLLAA